jgi:hypothetical protein
LTGRPATAFSQRSDDEKRLVEETGLLDKIGAGSLTLEAIP